MPKLVEVLSLPDLPEARGIECLQLLLSLLSSQVNHGSGKSEFCQHQPFAHLLTCPPLVSVAHLCPPCIFAIYHDFCCLLQEDKAQAVSAKVVQCVVPFLTAASNQMRQLSCQVLASLSQLFQGRLAILQTSGLAAVIAALDDTSEDGAICLQVPCNITERLLFVCTAVDIP